MREAVEETERTRFAKLERSETTKAKREEKEAEVAEAEAREAEEIEAIEVAEDRGVTEELEVAEEAEVEATIKRENTELKAVEDTVKVLVGDVVEDPSLVRIPGNISISMLLAKHSQNLKSVSTRSCQNYQHRQILFETQMQEGRERPTRRK